MQVFSLLDSFAIQSSKNILITVEACVKRLSGGRACRVSLWRDRETWENMRLVRYRKILHCGIFAAKTKSFPLGSLVEAEVPPRRPKRLRSGSAGIFHLLADKDINA